MRKVKAEVQVSVDGFMADERGRTDWMVWNWGPDWTWDAALRQYHTDLTTTSDCVVLSRTMATDGFVNHWQAVAADAASPQATFARHIGEIRKIVCTRTLQQSVWPNTEIANGSATDTVAQLKREVGKDIIVYGGANLVASLIEAQLIDEFHLFVNPTALFSGKTIWMRGETPLHLKLESCTAFDCGVAVHKYVPRRVIASS